MVRRFYQDVAQDDLLGPVFNDDSCGACHVSPAAGGLTAQICGLAVKICTVCIVNSAADSTARKNPPEIEAIGDSTNPE